MNSEIAKSMIPPRQEKKKKRAEVFVKDMKKNWQLHLIAVPVILFFLVFSYFPMVGIVTAFMNYRPTLGIFGSKWVYFDNFAKFVSDPAFWLALRNTVVMALLNLSFGFFIPIIFALLLAELRTKWFKRTLEICSYMPNFVAAVVVCNLVINMLGDNGIITNLFVFFGMERENMLANPNNFWAVNTTVVLWQSMGYAAIVFTAAIAGVNQDLHEAAVLDGANRWQRVWHVTLPAILPMIITMFILKVGLMFSTGFDNILLLYMPMTQEKADVISTFVYRTSVGGGNDFGYAAAVGLFQSIIATALLLGSNWLSNKVTKSSLF
ncbi:MAG: sugar ABC transporter permease [Lachnospiraceae bacterium]|nr:sugar ABC transporter permease [Lachnospiraceae bacterium]